MYVLCLTPRPGFPLPTLLRLAILILHTAPYRPVDVILSYSHLCLQNATFLDFVPHFYARAQVEQLVPASPLSMGMLTPIPPPWHPAPPELKQAVADAHAAWGGDFPELAVGYSLRQSGALGRALPLVVGFSNPREVHECVRVWREVRAAVGEGSEGERGEESAREVFRKAGYLGWSWASP